MIKKPSLIVAIGLLTAAIFAADLAIPLGIAVGVLYVLPILLAARIGTQARTVLVLTGVCTALTAVAWWWSPAEGGRVGAAGNRMVTLLTIWAVGAFAVRWKRIQGEVLTASELIRQEVEPAEGPAPEPDTDRFPAASRLSESVAHVLRHTNFLQSILDGITDGVVVVNEEGQFISFNPAAERILGMGMTPTTPDEWSRAYGLFLPDQATPMPREKLPLVRALGGENVSDVEIYVRHPEVPEGIWLSVNAAPLRDAEGAVRGAVAAFRDVSEHKTILRDMGAAKEAADEANRAKSVFLANMSHEIRTPLNAVLGITDLVLDSSLSQEQREYLHLVRTSGRTLLSLINDTLDFSRIESGKLTLEPVEFDLRDLAGSTAKSLAFQADSKGLELVCDIDPGIPRRVVGDPDKLRQVLFNLIGNAIKFTPEGSVTLRMDAGEPVGDRARIHVSIIDTGIGIPVGKQGAIFDPFEQVDSSIARRFGGTGLGLAISGKLIELMGGRIQVESEAGKGSTFRFTLDLGAVPGAETGIPAPASLRGERALVVDDHPRSRAALERLLATLGMEVHGVSSTRDAVRRVIQGRGARRGFAVTLVDAALFERGDCELSKQLQMQHGAAGRLVVMLSAGRTPEQIEHCQGMGVEAYLLKPLTESEVLESLVPAAEIPAPGPVPEKERRRSARGLRVLLAEDSPVNQRLAHDLLTRWGHEVTAVADGQQAVTAAETGTWDLILMDVQMPRMDGLEATRIIRSRGDAASRIPILAMTAHGTQNQRDECLAAGMDGFVGKPFDIDELFRTLESAAGSPAPPTPAGKPEETAENAGPGRGRPPEPVPETGTPSGADWEAALRSLGGDRSLLHKLVRTVLQESPRLVEAAERSLSEGDADGLRRAAHTLKGTIRYFGGSAIYDRARCIEELAASGDLEAAASVVRSLDREWERFARHLAAVPGEPGR